MYYSRQIFTGKIVYFNSFFKLCLCLHSLCSHFHPCLFRGPASSSFTPFNSLCPCGTSFPFFFSSSHLLLLLLLLRVRLTAHIRQAALDLWSFSFHLWTDGIYRHVPPAPLSRLHFYCPSSTVVGKLCLVQTLSLIWVILLFMNRHLLFFFSSIRSSFKSLMLFK